MFFPYCTFPTVLSDLPKKKKQKLQKPNPERSAKRSQRSPLHPLRFGWGASYSVWGSKRHPSEPLASFNTETEKLAPRPAPEPRLAPKTPQGKGHFPGLFWCTTWTKGFGVLKPKPDGYIWMVNMMIHSWNLCWQLFFLLALNKKIETPTSKIPSDHFSWLILYNSIYIYPKRDSHSIPIKRMVFVGAIFVAQITNSPTSWNCSRGLLALRPGYHSGCCWMPLVMAHWTSFQQLDPCGALWQGTCLGCT